MYDDDDDDDDDEEEEEDDDDDDDDDDDLFFLCVCVIKSVSKTRNQQVVINKYIASHITSCHNHDDSNVIHKYPCFSIIDAVCRRLSKTCQEWHVQQPRQNKQTTSNYKGGGQVVQI